MQIDWYGRSDKNLRTHFSLAPTSDQAGASLGALFSRTTRNGRRPRRDSDAARLRSLGLPTGLSPEEQELVDCYEECDDVRRSLLPSSARAATRTRGDEGQAGATR